MTFNKDQMSRYARHFVLSEIGARGQKALLNARVLIVGAGGLGSPLIQYLAAAGVGTLGIVDDGRVELSNLQRQVIYSVETIDHLKTTSAAAFTHALNADVQIMQHTARFTHENAAQLITDYDIIADCTDNFETRFIIHDATYHAQRTLVQAAAIRMVGQLAVYKPHTDQKLPCYRCFFPEPPEQDTFAPTCATAGVLGAIPGVMGAWQGIEVIKEILNIGDSLAGRLVLFDALKGSSRTISVPRDPACRLCHTRTL